MGTFSSDSIDHIVERNQSERLRKLEAFYKAVAQLTFDHDVIGDSAVVFPSKLGEELERVDPEWYKNA